MSRLETYSNIAVIVVAVFVTGWNLYDRFLVKPKGPSDDAQAALNRKMLGRPLPLPRTLVSGDAATVTLFISKNCHFCTDSMDFYRRLAEQRASFPGLKLLAVGPAERESRPDMISYLENNRVKPDGVDVVSFRDIEVSMTPTLVVHDGGKIVRGVWVGRLSQPRENEVLSHITSLCAKYKAQDGTVKSLQLIHP